MIVAKEELIPVPHPDAFACAYYSSSAGAVPMLMYTASIAKDIVDDVTTIRDPLAQRLTGTRWPGNHLAYFWLGKNERMADNNGMFYIRIPAQLTYWHGAFIYKSNSIKRIDFMSKTPPSLSANTFGNTMSVLEEIRVPKGCGSAYATAISKCGNGIKNKTNLIVETNDFTYSVS